MFGKKLFVLFLTGALLLAGCNAIATLEATPTPTQPAAETAAPTQAPTAAATLPPVITTTPSPTTAPTQAPTAVLTAVPVPGAIPHLASGSDVTVTQVRMFSATSGWGVGRNTAFDPLNEHVLRTTNGGAAWQDVTPPQKAGSGNTESGPALQANAFFLDSTHAWVGFAPQPGSATSANAIWYTADGGATWKASAPLNPGSGTPEFFAPGTIAFLPDGVTGWLLVHAGVGMNHDYVYVYNTTDGGANWKLKVDPLDINQGNIMSCYKSGLSFVDATTGWLAGSCNGVAAGVLLFQSKDAGATWSAVTLSAPPQAPSIFTAGDEACGAQPPVFVAAKDGFMGVTCQSFGTTQKSQSWIYVTADAGATWTPRPAPASQGSFQFIDPLTGWFVGDNEVYKTTNGGTSWTKMTQHVDWNAQLSFLDGSNGFAVATAGALPNVQYGLVSTTNGGATWALIKPKVK